MKKGLKNKVRAKNRQAIFVISGPSGSGKTTLLERLLKDKELKKQLVKSVSFTTRPKRSGEKDERDYFFITEKEFRQKLKAKKILEWTGYLGYYYGTPRDPVERYLKAGKSVILCLDLIGARKIKRLYPRSAVTVFIIPPSIEALRYRIESRCNRTKQEEIGRRLKLAEQELASSRKYDYCVFNRNLGKAVNQLKEIILTETNH